MWWGLNSRHQVWKTRTLPTELHTQKMAVREGFEPSVAFKDHNSLANCLFRPLRHLTVKSLTNSDFFKGRYYQSSAPLSSGVVLKWRLMSVLPGPSSFNELSFQDWCSQLISAYQPYKLVGIEGLEPPRISPRASKARTAANYVICPLKWSATSELNWLHMNPNHVCYRNTCDRLKW